MHRGPRHSLSSIPIHFYVSSLIEPMLICRNLSIPNDTEIHRVWTPFLKRLCPCNKAFLCDQENKVLLSCCVNIVTRRHFAELQENDKKIFSTLDFDPSIACQIEAIDMWCGVLDRSLHFSVAPRARNRKLRNSYAYHESMVTPWNRKSWNAL